VRGRREGALAHRGIGGTFGRRNYRRRCWRHPSKEEQVIVRPHHKKHAHTPANPSPRPAPGNSPQASRPSSPDSAPASETTGPHVHFKLQTYDNYDYKGSAQSFDEPGLFKSAWPIYSYIWTPARSGDYLDTSLLRCSVAFCANQTVTGWWGASIKNQPGDPSRNHSSNYIHIACDELNLNPECSGLDNPAVATLATTKDVLSLIPPSSAQDSIGTTSSSSAARVTTTPTPTSKSSTSSSSSFRPKSTSGSGSLSDTISATKTQA
jgi:hypothetical protein